ncbi:nitrate- and nitrite sensing domain-containing protein, partial [Micromonospora rubida]
AAGTPRPKILIARGGGRRAAPRGPPRTTRGARRGGAGAPGGAARGGAGAAGPAAPGELPVAGRRQRRVTTPRQSRPVPVRADDVLAPAAGVPADGGGGWWSREGPTAGVAPAAPAPPAVPVTGGTNERGLPVRVPMAQLSAVTRSARPQKPTPRHDPDPEAVGGMLSRLYSGVRRAEAEETTEIILPPVGGSTEGGQQ